MKLKVTQANLNKALSIVSRVAASRSSLPVLSNILLTAKNNRLKVAATNLEIAITYSVACKVSEEGSITVPARLMHEFVNSLPDENIELELAKQALLVKSSKYKSTINGVSSEEFPSLPKIDTKKKYSITSDKLTQALQSTVFAASNDEARQVLTGVYLHSYKGNLYIASTDSYRLAEKNLGKFDGEINLIIPSNSMQEVLRIANDVKEDITYSYDDSQISFTVGEVEIISRLVDGKYPDYRQLIPKDNDTVFTVNKDDFINITKVSSLFARESAGSITLKVDEDSQEISIRSIASQVGENVSRANAEVDGEGEVTLNSRYLMDALSAFESKKVTVAFSGKINPCVITPVEGDQDYLHIVMPLRS